MRFSEKGDVNQHGLARDIPSDAARRVRQECGFGCVICGSAFYDYEHIEPEFKDAHEHDPDRIALLCRDCHGRVPHFLSKEAVWEGRRHPRCKSQGFSFGPLDVGSGELTFTLGGLWFHNPGSILRVNGVDLLYVERPEHEGGPLRISGTFCDAAGQITARITRNRLVMFPETWDVEVSGSEVTFRRAKRDLALRLIFFPRKGMRIDRLKMLHDGVTIEVGDDTVRVGTDKVVTTPSNVVFQDCKSCLVIENGRLSFGEELGPNAAVMRGNVRFVMCGFPQGLVVPNGSSALLATCMVQGGVRLEGDGRLELTGTAVMGTNPGAPTRQNDQDPT